MEITIKDLYENIDTLPKSFYKQVNDYLKFLKSQYNSSEDCQVPQWQIDETNRRIKYAEEHPETIVSEENFNEYLKKLEDEI